MVTKNLNVLIIGFGSIGNRHAANLFKLGVKSISVFRSSKIKTKYKNIDKIKTFFNFNQAINYKKYHLAIIANPTSEHIKYAIRLAKKKINIYIEKPLSNSLEGIQVLKKLEKKNKIKIIIGCQLRCHPGLIFIKKLIEKKVLGKIYSVSSDVGQHLPYWHKKENYRNSYAAQKKLGGGVILTLIHEIDYLYWLFGRFKNVYGIGGNLTKLGIDTEDTVISNINTVNKIPISLRMDYWRIPPVRTLNIVFEKGQIFWNFYKKNTEVIFNNGKKIIKRLPNNWNKNEMFISLIKDFINNSLFGNKKPKIPLKDGIYVLKTAISLKKSLNLGKKIEIKI